MELRRDYSMGKFRNARGLGRAEFSSLTTLAISPIFVGRSGKARSYPSYFKGLGGLWAYARKRIYVAFCHTSGPARRIIAYIRRPSCHLERIRRKEAPALKGRNRSLVNPVGVGVVWCGYAVRRLKPAAAHVPPLRGLRASFPGPPTRGVSSCAGAGTD